MKQVVQIMAENADLLSSLLDIAESELNALSDGKSTSRKKLSEVDLFSKNEEEVVKTSVKEVFGDLSSDDEPWEEKSNLNENGREIKKILSSSLQETKSANYATSLWKNKTSCAKNVLTQGKGDSIFGINLVNPLMSSKLINEKMSGMQYIPISTIRNHLAKISKESEWVIAGVVCAKGVNKTSAKGNPFTVLTMSDLLGDIKTISMFLFGGACTDFRKTSPGSVLAITNPYILEKNGNSKDQAVLSVTNPQKVLLLGQSQDFGTCSSKTKSGNKCRNIVNKKTCEVCKYHMRSEHMKINYNFDLKGKQPNGLVALRNKVLGKNEVFYAGKSFTALKNKKETSAGPKRKIMDSINYTGGQRAKDLELLQKLRGNVEISKSPSGNIPAIINEAVIQPKNETKLTNSVKNLEIPTVPSSSNSTRFTLKQCDLVDLSAPMSRNQNRAKLNALKFIEKNGKIKKNDPNNTTKKVKRKIELNDLKDVEPAPKKVKESVFYSDRFKKIMEMHEKNNEALLELHDNKQKEIYFDKLEFKERLEEKMSNTYKIETKAVQCLNCKYTSFSASDKCKSEKHKLRVFDTFKRFFKCKNCKRRITVLDIVPVKPCTNCNDNRWERTTLMKEKIHTSTTSLSIRGGEQTHTNSNITDANINLLVPDNENNA